MTAAWRLPLFLDMSAWEVPRAMRRAELGPLSVFVIDVTAVLTADPEHVNFPELFLLALLWPTSYQ